MKEVRGLILKMQRKGNGKEKEGVFLGEAIPSSSGARDPILGLCEMKANKKCRRLKVSLVLVSYGRIRRYSRKEGGNKQRLELRRQKAGFVSIWMSCVCVSVDGCNGPINQKKGEMKDATS